MSGGYAPGAFLAHGKRINKGESVVWSGVKKMIVQGRETEQRMK